MRCQIAVAALAVVSSLAAIAQAPAPQAAPTADQVKAAAAMPFRNPALPVEKRVDDLVSRLTLEEKVSQMIDRAAAIPRLDIPAYNWWNEGLHGIARSGFATMFPQAIGNAATWDAPLVHSIGAVVSTEARAKYNDALRHDNHDRYFGLTIWSPNINIFRDPRWGRGQETYGEDPFLTARLGTAFVKGIQGDDPKYLRAIATPSITRCTAAPSPRATRPTSTPASTTCGTPTSRPFAPPSPRARRTPSCAPTTPSIKTPPARAKCCSAISSAATGASRATSSPTATPLMTSASPKAITTPPTTRTAPQPESSPEPISIVALPIVPSLTRFIRTSSPKRRSTCPSNASSPRA